MHSLPTVTKLPVLASGALLWLLALPFAHSHELQQPPYEVLILNSFNQDTEPYAAAREDFIGLLQARSGSRISFRQFDLQQRNGSEEESDTLRAQLLKSLYAGEVPNLVVAIGPPAAGYWLQHRGQVFPDVSALMVGSQAMLNEIEVPPQDVLIVNQWTFEEIIDNILQLLPGTRHIMILYGGSENERKLAALSRQALEPYSNRVDMQYADGLSLADLRSKLESLPADSAVLLGIYDSDANGVILGGGSSLAFVRGASNAPIFGFFEEDLGHGIVGGPLIPLQRNSEEMVAAALEILLGGSPRTKLRIIPMTAPTYDFRELQKWNINPARLPENSIVRYRQPSTWDIYAPWILLAMLVLLVQAVLIVGLLLQRRQRRLAEQASLSLTRRLITAHEDEQRRIARELHDDLSQRLARLSIDAGYLAANPGGKEAAEVARDMQPRLVGISKDVHDMSYLLHPTMVDDLGISAALNSECERMRRRSTANITERIGDIPQNLPHETALALFRIAQEALHNADRHAGANNIELSLDFDGTVFRLVVRDDGRGFDASAGPHEHGLGLYSMQERAALLSGTLKINSDPGTGTRVVAIIPLAGGRK